MSSTPPNIKTCLRQWRRKRGVKKTGKSYGNEYYTIPIRERRRLIIIFLRWMRMLGLEEERFRKQTFIDELISVCFGDAPAFDERKRKAGHAALKEELEDILDTEGIFNGKRAKNRAPKPAPQAAAPVPAQSDFKPIGRDINPTDYNQDDGDKPQLDPEWAALMGVTEDE